MANGLQGMSVVTTYPPRRKAIRAAQVRYFFLARIVHPHYCRVSVLGCSCTRNMGDIFFSDSYGWVAYRATCSRF